MADDARSQQVSLGCGTLILIALIVLIFSGGDTDKLEREVRKLQSEISNLEQAIESQSAEIRLLRERLTPAEAGGTADE